MTKANRNALIRVSKQPTVKIAARFGLAPGTIGMIRMFKSEEEMRKYFRAWKQGPKGRAYRLTPEWKATTVRQVGRHRARRSAAYRGCHLADAFVSWMRGRILPCYWCGLKRKATLEHLLPVSRGGLHEIENLQVA